MILEINPNWTFKETISNLRALRTQYDDILCSFSYFQLPQRVEFLKNTRNTFYSFNYPEWKKDLIWEYMNHFIDFDILQKIK